MRKSGFKLEVAFLETEIGFGGDKGINVTIQGEEKTATKGKKR